MKFVIIFITAASRKQGEKIADVLISKKLVACVSIVRQVESVFIWQGKKEHVNEALLIAKTKFSLFNKIKKQVKKIHSYEVPEIIVLPIIAGNKEYLRWIDTSVE